MEIIKKIIEKMPLEIFYASDYSGNSFTDYNDEKLCIVILRTGYVSIYPDTGYNFKIGLTQEVQDIGFFDALII